MSDEEIKEFENRIEELDRTGVGSWLSKLSPAEEKQMHKITGEILRRRREEDARNGVSNQIPSMTDEEREEFRKRTYGLDDIGFIGWPTGLTPEEDDRLQKKINKSLRQWQRNEAKRKDSN